MGKRKEDRALSIIDTWRATGRNVSETGRLHFPDRTENNQRRDVRRALDWGVQKGEILPGEYDPTPTPSATFEQVASARARLVAAHDRKKAKGDWRKARLIPNVFHGPIVLGIFGDPHLDNAGTDVDLFLKEVARRDPERGIFTCCLGDFFDNWTRSLGHLYQGAPDPEDAWTVFEDAMQEHPFLFACTGNHDKWATGAVNFLKIKMREWGIVTPDGGGTFVLDLGEPVTVAMRHIWRGSSMYSDAHALISHAMTGKVDADLIAGGHVHKGEARTYVRPHDGRVMQVAQVSAFKRLDDYANERGFISADMPPVVWAVIDPREPLTSHQRVQLFYDFHTALAVRDHQRGRNGAPD